MRRFFKFLLYLIELLVTAVAVYSVWNHGANYLSGLSIGAFDFAYNAIYGIPTLFSDPNAYNAYIRLYNIIYYSSYHYFPAISAFITCLPMTVRAINAVSSVAPLPEKLIDQEKIDQDKVNQEKTEQEVESQNELEIKQSADNTNETELKEELDKENKVVESVVLKRLIDDKPISQAFPSIKTPELPAASKQVLFSPELKNTETPKEVTPFSPTGIKTTSPKSSLLSLKYSPKPIDGIGASMHEVTDFLRKKTNRIFN